MKVFAISLHGVIAGTLVATTGLAFADSSATSYQAPNNEAPNNEAPNNDRSGVVIGATVQGGVIGCETKRGKDCGHGTLAAGGFSVHAGMMITPTLALLGEASVMAHTEDSLTASQFLATANMRAWLTQRLWLQGGLGVARSKLSFEGRYATVSSVSATVPAVSAAVGFELVRSPTFGLDLELRAGSGLSRDDVRIRNASVGLGVTFF